MYSQANNGVSLGLQPCYLARRIFYLRRNSTLSLRAAALGFEAFGGVVVPRAHKNPKEAN